jgi:uncharacterized membrane protein HdeD (DUF308 family)
MNCPHREPCEQCREFERSNARVFAWICAVWAIIAGLFAVALALDLDPRAPGWIGMAIGGVLMWNYFRAELRPA